MWEKDSLFLNHPQKTKKAKNVYKAVWATTILKNRKKTGLN